MKKSKQYGSSQGYIHWPRITEMDFSNREEYYPVFGMENFFSSWVSVTSSRNPVKARNSSQLRIRHKEYFVCRYDIFCLYNCGYFDNCAMETFKRDLYRTALSLVRYFDIYDNKYNYAWEISDLHVRIFPRAALQCSLTLSIYDGSGL